jgi:transposase
MAKKRYGSDITIEQFELVRPILESARKRTKPRVVDLYEVFCAVLYLLKTGCQWRLIPHDFPKWRTVHKYFQDWSRKGKDEEASCLDQALKKIGWRGAYETGAQRMHKLLYNRLTECKEY